MIVSVGDLVSFKRMGNSADMSLGKVLHVNVDISINFGDGEIPISYKSIQVEFITKKRTWDKETRTWKEGTFIRTIKNLKGMKLCETRS